jgi:hypothetical protein
MFAQAGDDGGVVLGAFAALGLDGHGIQAAITGGSEAGRVGLIREDDGDFAAGELSGCDVVGDGEEVGAASGEKDAQALHQT